MSSLIRDLAAATPEMLEAFGDETLVRAALAFEGALARAQAAEGLITAAEAEAVARACAEPVDLAELAAAAAHAGTLAIPIADRLRRTAPMAHFGATSQDLADTALLLQCRAGVFLISTHMRRLTAALAQLAERHAAAPMLGRTLLQPALPITFGLKAANWLLLVDGAARRLHREVDEAFVLQLGGAAGTLAGMKGKGAAVAARMAAELGLKAGPTPWQGRRDGLAGLASALAILAGALGKIARDVSLLAQGEVAEAFEPRAEGRGGSSAMAHKRNPTGCQVVLSAAIRAPHLAATIVSALPQEHERGLGGWQAEAPVLAELFGMTHGALAALVPVIEGLDVDTTRMAANLAAAGVGDDFGEAEQITARALAAWRDRENG
jgi:3-carboxy-cis,cis-muconate cycloisomerase